MISRIMPRVAWSAFGGKKLLLLAATGAIVFLVTGCANVNPAVNKVVTPTPGQEGQACSSDKPCQQDLNCIKNICSSGKVGSACSTYKDCQTSLYCLKSVCANPPSYTKYFNKITISKMKAMPPGPNNIPVPSTTFKNTEAVEIDVAGKPGVSGIITYELINSTTGETSLSNTGDSGQTAHMIGNFGTGFIIPQDLVGNFDLNIYFNSELVYTTPIAISQ